MEVKYTARDTENILEVLEMEGIQSLLNLLNVQLKNMEQKVLNFDLNKDSFANLAIEKARYEGAKLLVTKLNHELNRVATLNAKGKQ